MFHSKPYNLFFEEKINKEQRMKQEDINKIMGQIKTIFCEKQLNALGKSLKFSQRERIITPARLGLSLIKAFACGKVETIADMPRCFNELFDEKVAYKPFHNQLAKKGFSEFMRAMVSKTMEHLFVKVLDFEKQCPLADFKSIYIQDGTSFRINSNLYQVFPSRFHKNKTVKEAAVELHVTYDLCHENPIKITLTADKESERGELPETAELQNSLLLADAGYPDTKYFTQVQSRGGFYLMRMQKKINPFVFKPEEAITKKYSKKSLKERKKSFSKNKCYDLDVVFRDDKTNTRHRLLVIWNKEKKEYIHLITNLPREKYTAEQLITIYQLRWQIELVFKEWKSYANLHKFNTANENITEGFIWAAIIAALIKRFMAHSTQIIKKVQVSTRKVAMCSTDVLRRRFEALAIGSLHYLKKAICKMIDYLGNNALRAHPKRDRDKGRLKIGMKPVFKFLKN